MTTLKCPGCGAAMASVVEPDLTRDVCKACMGTWLDRGELNALLIGMSGDIEFASVHNDSKEQRDDKPLRACPRCESSTLRKSNLLKYSAVVFDHCDSCGGFFLDAGELASADRALEVLSGGGSERREPRNGRLVRFEESAVAAASYDSTIAAITYTGAVYFRAPLGAGLHLTQRSWTERVLRRLWKDSKSVATGDAAFDAFFQVHATDAERAKALLTPAARGALLQFAKSGATFTSQRGTLELGDAAIAYREGPFQQPSALADAIAEAEGQPKSANRLAPEVIDKVLDALAAIAEVIES